MSNAEPDPSRPNGAASGSLGAMYETAVRHTIAMPNVAGTSIGSAYESWFVSASHDDEAVAHVIDALPAAARAAAASTDSSATL